VSEREGAHAAVEPKENPEALVLRGRPRPVIRFRRGLIVGVAGAATAAIAVMAWVALDPPSLNLEPGADAPELAAQGPDDSLAAGPATYADVPQLGPPLPGDLGRPILDQQRKRGAVPVRWAGDADPSAETMAAEEQRRTSEEQAARASAVLVPLASAAASVPEPPIADRSGRATGDRADASAPPDHGAGRQRKMEFAGPGPRPPGHGLVDAASPWMLSAGTVIPASLITGLNSDLPGIVLAQVTQAVRDSATGTQVLIPQGARLVGRYDSNVGYGQRRLMLVWERAIFPDGSWLDLGTMPATDPGGYSGIEDEVDVHGARLLNGIALSTLLGVGTELGFSGGDSDLARAIERSAGQDGARAGDRLVARNLDVQPTLTVRPGWPVRAVLHTDLVLKPWRG
jgi:type IV secretion system protein VirB10